MLLIRWEKVLGDAWMALRKKSNAPKSSRKPTSAPGTTGGGSYFPGDIIQCSIFSAKLKDGYHVIVSENGLIGYLKTVESYKVGEQVLAEFVSFKKDRVNLTERALLRKKAARWNMK